MTGPVASTLHVRRARPDDAAAMGAVHVAAWRDAYAGVLPDAYLANLSVARIAAGYQRGLLCRRPGEAAFVAESGPPGRRPSVVGFATCGPARGGAAAFGGGEVETLYVLSDWRERGLGRRLLRASAAHLSATGRATAVLWVLSDNGARWFYQRLGGRPVARERIAVGGREVEQTAYAWDPIGALLEATATQPGPG